MIKRYELYDFEDALRAHPNGYWVKATDAIARINHQDEIFNKIEQLSADRRLKLISETEFAESLYFLVSLRGPRGIPKT